MGGLSAGVIALIGSFSVAFGIPVVAIVSSTVLKLRRMQFEEAERIRRHQAEVEARVLGLAEPTQDGGIALRLEALERDVAELERRLGAQADDESARRIAALEQELAELRAAVRPGPRIAPPHRSAGVDQASEQHRIDA
jgi:hypothetical protein